MLKTAIELQVSQPHYLSKGNNVGRSKKTMCWIARFLINCMYAVNILPLWLPYRSAINYRCNNSIAGPSHGQITPPWLGSGMRLGRQARGPSPITLYLVQMVEL